MADKGILNPAFQSDETYGSHNSSEISYGPLEPSEWREVLATLKRPQHVNYQLSGENSIELQEAKKHIKSASVGAPMKWKKNDSIPGKVLRAWKDAQISLDLDTEKAISDTDDEKSGWKAKETQTEEPATTISSWKILITEAENERCSENASGAGDTSEYVVVETRSLGFDVATQTKDSYIFRYTNAQAFEMVMAWRMITVFLPITWYLLMYITDQATDIAVAVTFCSEKDWWWCGFTLTFLIVPSLIINGYAYEQLVRPDIASVAPVNKWFARALAVAQVAPHYLIFRKWSWCYRAWRKVSWKQRDKKPLPENINNPSNTKKKAQKHRKSAKILFDQAKAETYSETAKWYQSFLESTPQLSIQAYVLMVKWQTKDPVSVPSILIASVVISLASASAGLASMSSDKAWERIAAAIAIFLTLGSRVLVCSGIGSIDPAYWIVPLGTSVLVGVITKISEAKDTALRSLAIKMYKYVSEAFVMATVCPPYNALGVFTSIPYVLGGLVFLLRMPENWINIATFICSILGQVVWLTVGFFVK